MDGRRVTTAVGAALLAVTIVLLAALPAGAANGSTVSFVGDSIGRDAEAQARAFVEPEHSFAYYDAVAAGNLPYYHPLLRNVVNKPNGPDIAIIEIGTGDALYETSEATFEAGARDLLDDIVPQVDCVRWMDTKETPNRAFATVNAYTPGINRAIHRLVDDYPTVEYFHYDAWTRLAGNGYFLADLLHHNATGRTEMGRMVDQAVDSCDETLTSGPYWDVRDSFWAADDIAWMADEDIADGYANHTFRAVVGSLTPPVTRAQMANFLWNLEGAPTGYGPHPWSDGPVWVNQALRWLAATGIANGYGDTFRPAASVTRAQMANFLWRLADSPTGFADHPWTDGPAWIDDALDWLAATGIANGFGDNFNPNEPLTRAAMAHLLHEFAITPPLAPPPAAPETTGAPPTTAPAPPSTAPPLTTLPAPTATTPTPSPPVTTVPNTTTPPPA